jgi:hypothetical protein
MEINILISLFQQVNTKLKEQIFFSFDNIFIEICISIEV